MSKKKSKKSSAQVRKGPSMATASAKQGPRSRGISILIVVVIIAAIGAALWGMKSLAGGSAAQEDPSQPEGRSASQSAASPSSQAGIWELNATSTDLDEVSSLGVPAIIDFGSDECVPCKAMAPVLRDTNKSMQGKALVKFVDVWEYPDAANGFPIQVIPTQVLINADGTPFEPSAALERDYGLQFSTYSDKATGKLAFTTHQGALTQEQMDAILKEMGV